MSQKEKNKISNFERITSLNYKKELPLTVLGLTISEKTAPTKSSFSSFYHTECYYTIVFYKPISKIFSHSHE